MPKGVEYWDKRILIDVIDTMTHQNIVCAKSHQISVIYRNGHFTWHGNKILNHNDTQEVALSFYTYIHSTSKFTPRIYNYIVLAVRYKHFPQVGFKILERHTLLWKYSILKLPKD